jgi:DNA-directed RNA polymerase specialized sigma24 family protein
LGVQAIRRSVPVGFNLSNTIRGLTERRLTGFRPGLSAWPLRQDLGLWCRCPGSDRVSGVWGRGPDRPTGPSNMAEDDNFRDLVRRVRSGDGGAAEELVRRYEPALRIAVRVRLTDRRLRRVLDSVDVCQSVLASFFVRAASGQFDLDRPEQLLGLLATMARNKVTNLALKERAARRGGGRVRAGLGDADPADPAPSASQVVAGEELLRAFRDRLSVEERDLADRRARGDAWADIAEGVGGDPDALRMRLGRAIDRVTGELGLA